VVRDRKSSSSDSSYDRSLIKLTKVTAYVYRFQKLFPMDSAQLKVYLENERMTDKDAGRVDKLVKGSMNFSNPRTSTDRGERQSDYFLSTLRVHNVSVMRKLQLAANNNVGTMTKLFHSLFGVGLNETDALIARTAKLIDAMAFEGFYVGIDRRVLHATETTMDSFCDVFIQDRRVGEYTLSVIEEKVSRTIKSCRDSIQTIRGVDGQVGIGWKFRNTMVLPFHVYGRMGNESRNSCVVIRENEESDFVVCHVDEPSITEVRLRLPVSGEQVLVVALMNDTDEFVVMGVYNIFDTIGKWCITRAFDFGYSGAGVIAIKDGAMLGMYLGRYMQVEGMTVGHVVTTGEYVSDVARSYKVDID